MASPVGAKIDLLKHRQVFVVAMPTVASFDPHYVTTAAATAVSCIALIATVTWLRRESTRISLSRALHINLEHHTKSLEMFMDPLMGEI